MDDVNDCKALVEIGEQVDILAWRMSLHSLCSMMTGVTGAFGTYADAAAQVALSPEWQSLVCDFKSLDARTTKIVAAETKQWENAVSGEGVDGVAANNRPSLSNQPACMAACRSSWTRPELDYLHQLQARLKKFALNLCSRILLPKCTLPTSWLLCSALKQQVAGGQRLPLLHGA